MHSLISRLLQKRGIGKLDELSAEEKQTFDTWQSVLSKDELTMADLKQFCQAQVDFIEGRWGDLTMAHHAKTELLPYHTVYKAILNIMDSPKKARAAMEQQLTQMLDAV